MWIWRPPPARRHWHRRPLLCLSVPSVACLNARGRPRFARVVVTARAPCCVRRRLGAAARADGVVTHMASAFAASRAAAAAASLSPPSGARAARSLAVRRSGRVQRAHQAVRAQSCAALPPSVPRSPHTPRLRGASAAYAAATRAQPARNCLRRGALLPRFGGKFRASAACVLARTLARRFARLPPATRATHYAAAAQRLTCDM